MALNIFRTFTLCAKDEYENDHFMLVVWLFLNKKDQRLFYLFSELVELGPTLAPDDAAAAIFLLFLF